MPEQSYELELLGTPVPFSNRVEFLSYYVKPLAKCETAQHIANRLNVSVAKVEAMAAQVGSASRVTINGMTEYALYTREVIEEEIAWQEFYDSLDEELSAYAIGTYLAKSEVWVKKTASSLDIYPELKWISENRQGYVYPKNLADMLRTIILHTPPANDLFSMDEAEELLGVHRGWIKEAIEQYNLPTEIRTLSISQKEGVHLPQKTLDVLQSLRAELPPLAGDWLTATRLGTIVGRDKKWVRAHIGPYGEQGLALAPIRENPRYTIPLKRSAIYAKL